METRQTNGFVWLMFYGLLTASSGCGLLPHLSYWAGASLEDPEYAGLAGQRVAVICVTDSSSYGAGTEAQTLARLISATLRTEVEDIDVVPAAEIADWIDHNGWDQIDYREVGRGVRADRVVAINLEGFRLHEGQSLYKGRATVNVGVYDMQQGGRKVYDTTIPEITYPSVAFYNTTEISEPQFRRKFLHVIARRVAIRFFTYDVFEEGGPDLASPR